MSSSVTIGSTTFYGDGTSAEWIYNALAGWYSGAPLRGGSEDYPNADGASPVDIVYRSARPLKFRGALVGDSSGSAIQKWMQFASIQSSGVPITLTVVDDFGTLRCNVSVDGSPSVMDLTSSAAEVEVSLIAYDPVKYGPSRLVSTGLATAGGGLEYPLEGPSGALYYGALGDLGRVTLTNSGSARVWPTLTVTGTLTAGFFVQRLDTGEVVRYDRVVPSGSDVAIDFRTGEVLIDGTSDGSTYLTRYEFFSVGPGESIQVQFNAIGGSADSPRAYFTIADGWW